MFYQLDQQSIEQMHTMFSKEQTKLMEEIRSIQDDEKRTKKMLQQISSINTISTQLMRLKSLRKE